MQKSSYFGLASLVFAAVSVIFLAIFFAVSQMNIPPALFNEWNQTSASISCISAPLAILLAVIGLQGSSTSKLTSSLSIFLVSAPFLVLMGQFALEWLP
jgi:hypothetical protein